MWDICARCSTWCCFPSSGGCVRTSSRGPRLARPLCPRPRARVFAELVHRRQLPALHQRLYRAERRRPPGPTRRRQFATARRRGRRSTCSFPRAWCGRRCWCSSMAAIGRNSRSRSRPSLRQGASLTVLPTLLSTTRWRPPLRSQRIVEECRAAVASLSRFDRLVVAGSSAGAHLAAMAALAADQRVKGAVLVSGIYDLEPLIGTSIDAALGLDPATAARNSPLRRPLEGFPRSLVCWGENETDQFKRQSRAFAAGAAPGRHRVRGVRVPRPQPLRCHPRSGRSRHAARTADA